MFIDENPDYVGKYYETQFAGRVGKSFHHKNNLLRFFFGRHRRRSRHIRSQMKRLSKGRAFWFK